MSKEKYQIHLSKTDQIDITESYNEYGELVHLVINYRARFKETGEKWYEIFRVDTCHKYLHEQRYWINPDPIPVELRDRTLLQVFEDTLEKMKTNYWKYKQMFRKSKLGQVGKINDGVETRRKRRK